jgi:hypothetical protein
MKTNSFLQRAIICAVLSVFEIAILFCAFCSGWLNEAPVEANGVIKKVGAGGALDQYRIECTLNIEDWSRVQNGCNQILWG